MRTEEKLKPYYCAKCRQHLHKNYETANELAKTHKCEQS